MRLFGALTVAFVVTISGCSGYGDYEVANRQEVSRSELPGLNEVPWQNADFDFFVSSELHAKVAPEIEWIGPIGNMISRLPADKRGGLEQNWDLPIRDRCLYVNARRASRSWRIQHKDRTLFLATYRIDSVGQSGAEKRGYRLSVIDESRGMWRYDFDISGSNIRVLNFDDRIAVLQEDRNRILVRDLLIEGRGLTFSQPRTVVEAPGSFRFWNVAKGPNGEIHVAWSFWVGSEIKRSPAFYSTYDGSPLTESRAQQISRSATGQSIKLVPRPSRILIAWLDARFKSGFVGIRNASKLFVAEVDMHSSSVENAIVLTPKGRGAGDNAADPFGVVWDKDRLVVFWAEVASSSFGLADLKYGALDFEKRELYVSAGVLGGSELLQAATRRMTEVQRANPIGNELGPPASECDRWREILDAYPAKAWIVGPDGPTPMLIPKDKDSEAGPGEQ